MYVNMGFKMTAMVKSMGTEAHFVALKPSVFVKILKNNFKIGTAGLWE